mmetsp:Transcript_59481/g.67676  ORF Transcript_59481/g.67676 Transcript_59481/m.67676 type:complete len:108 (+) Transcript_59481:120-443(+)
MKMENLSSSHPESHCSRSPEPRSTTAENQSWEFVCEVSSSVCNPDSADECPFLLSKLSDDRFWLESLGSFPSFFLIMLIFFCNSLFSVSTAENWLRNFFSSDAIAFL